MAYLDSVEAVCKFVSLLLIDVVAFGGNTLILAAGLRCKQLRKFSNAFIFNVAIADICQSLFIIPFALASVYYDRWPLSSITCQVIALLKVIITLASVQSLAGISLVRYYYIVRNISMVETKTRLVISLTAVWIISLLLAVAPPLGWGELGFDDGKAICTILFYKTMTHTVVVFSTGLLVPVSIMGFCYYKIINIMRLQRMKIRSWVTGNSVYDKASSNKTSANDSQSSQEHSFKGETIEILKVKERDDEPKDGTVSGIELVVPNQHSNNKSKGLRKAQKSHLTPKDYQLLRTVTLVIIVFLACWFPYAFYNALRAADVVRDNNTIDTINMWMGFFNSAVNPFLYGLTNRQFRQAVKSLLFNKDY